MVRERTRLPHPPPLGPEHHIGVADAPRDGGAVRGSGQAPARHCR
jgi:hypothetical protein